MSQLFSGKDKFCRTRAEKIFNGGKRRGGKRRKENFREVYLEERFRFIRLTNKYSTNSALSTKQISSAPSSKLFPLREFYRTPPRARRTLREIKKTRREPKIPPREFYRTPPRARRTLREIKKTARD